jgi:hypothetical protein
MLLLTFLFSAHKGSKKDPNILSHSLEISSFSFFPHSSLIDEKQKDHPLDNTLYI